MRILLVTPLFFPLLSGAAVYFDTLSQGLTALEPALRVTILTRALRGAPLRERRGRVRVLRLLPGAADAGGRGRIAALATPLLVLAVSRLLRSDVIHYHTLASYRGLRLLAPLCRAPMIGDMRDLAARDEGADLRHYQHCSRVICASENIHAFLRQRGFPADRLAHIPIPFSPPAPAPADRVLAAKARWGLPPEAPYALFVGPIIPAKGVRELLEAMAIVWQRLPRLRLVLAGPLTPEGDALFPEGFRAAVGGLDRAAYLGPVPHEDVLLLLQGSALFVLPSRSEGLPRSCLEAIALRRPVALPPGIPEFQRACPGAVLERVAPEAIAAGILRAAAGDGIAEYPLADHDATRTCGMTLALYRSVTA